MSNLLNALNALRRGMAYENSNSKSEIYEAIKAYQEAISYFSQLLLSNEIKDQSFLKEVEKHIAIYPTKARQLQSKYSNLKSDHVKSEPFEEILSSRIESTILADKPTTRFKDIAGLDDVKKSLRKAVVLPIKHPELFEEFRFRGFLLFGPPGTGKSYLAQAVAGEAEGTSFFSLSASDLLSKYRGESENLIKSLFKSARKMKPSIIFIDEVDSLALSRTDSDNDGARGIKSELFVQMQGTSTDNSGVFVLAATNTPHNLDEAFLRRFDKLLYIPLPDEAARYELFRMHFKQFENTCEQTLVEASKISDGLSGSDITIIATKAKMMAIDELEEAKYFQKVTKCFKQYWRACTSQSEGAIRMNFDDIPENSLDFYPSPKKEDVLRCVKEARARTDQTHIRRMERFAEEKGEKITRPEVQIVKTKISKTRRVLEFLLNFW